MTELGVSDEQFVAACEKASENPIHKKIVDQIMAVDNFLAFKRLMVKRNQELNRQAMEMYEKMLKRNAEAGANANAAATTAGADKPAEENKAKDAADPNAADAEALAAAGLLSKEEKEKQAAELREVMKVA